MTEELANQQRWSAGIGVITACIAAVLAVLGVTLVFGGYKTTVDTHTETIREHTGEIKVLKEQVVTKQDLKELKDAMIRLEQKIDRRKF